MQAGTNPILAALALYPDLAEEPLPAAAAAELLLQSGAVHSPLHSPIFDDNETLPDESDIESVFSDEGDVPDSCLHTYKGPIEALHYLATCLHTYLMWPGFPHPALSVRALLRNGASILAAFAPGRPTPLSLARSLHAKGMAAEGSAAALVLKAAEPWSPASHELFPDPARAHAVQLLLVGHSLSRLPKHESVAQAIFDIWLFHVMPHVVVRESK